VLRKLKEFIIHKKKYEANVKRKSVLKKYLEHINFFVCDTLGKEKISIEEILRGILSE
jgi:DNA topoisomerase VI subunit B